tara:strand:- start:339 stop:578 length:240 start_codon:yes stop_codon:yes gene_type:complete
MTNTYQPKLYLLIEWPESKRVLSHPEAKFLNDLSESGSNDILGGIRQSIPPEIWDQYKDSEYIDPSDERKLVIQRDNQE